MIQFSFYKALAAARDAVEGVYPTRLGGGVRGPLTREFRTLVGGVERRISVANPRWVHSPEARAIRVRAVERTWGDIDRPHLIVGSSKVRRMMLAEVGLGHSVVMLGRRCHLNRHS